MKLNWTSRLKPFDHQQSDDEQRVNANCWRSRHIRHNHLHLSHLENAQQTMGGQLIEFRIDVMTYRLQNWCAMLLSCHIFMFFSMTSDRQFILYCEGRKMKFIGQFITWTELRMRFSFKGVAKEAQNYQLFIFLWLIWLEIWLCYDFWSFNSLSRGVQLRIGTFVAQFSEFVFKKSNHENY